MRYKCPKNADHTGWVIIMIAKPSPHFAELVCKECNHHIKWLSSHETRALQNKAESEKEERVMCPISREPCMEESCAWWWKVGDMGNCLVMRIGKLMSMPLVTVETKDD